MRPFVVIASAALAVACVFAMPALATADPPGVTSQSVEFRRIYGADRYGTAVAISQVVANDYNLEHPDYAHEVVIASGENWPDALVAGVLADAQKPIPLLLVRGSSVPAVVEEELLRLGTKHILIVGGTGAVSTAVEESLAQLPDVEEVERVGGADRYETADLVAIRVHRLGSPPTKAWIVTGHAFPDALTASAVAGSGGKQPILLADGDTLREGTYDTLDRLDRVNVDGVIIVGGEAAVGPGVVDQIAPLLPEERVFRFGGANRYETAVAVAEAWVDDWPLSHDPSPYIASGEEFPDALTGAVFCAQANEPILLTLPDRLPPSIAALVRKKWRDHNRPIIFGGPGAVSPAVEDDIRQAVE